MRLQTGGHLREWGFSADVLRFVSVSRYDFDYMSQLKEFERDSQAYRVPVLSSLVMSMQTKKKSKEGQLNSAR